MNQIKIFKTLEFDIDAMESQVNDWLAKTGARVISMTGNIAPQTGSTSGAMGGGAGTGSNPSDVILFILYEKL